MLMWSNVILLPLLIAYVHSARIDNMCGFSTRTLPRILADTPARKGAWPWMAAIFIEYGGVRKFSIVNCGGSLISNEFVLTAAHCVFWHDGTTRRLTSAYTIRFGDLDILSTNDNAEITEVGVLEVIPHPAYDSKKTHNDIALLRIDKPIVTFTESVRPVCLPSPTLRNENLTGFEPSIPGWGTISTGGKSNNILRQVQVQIVTNEQCKQSYSRFIKQSTIEPKQLCAARDRGGKGDCVVDSGGPLTLAVNERWTIIGVFSFGYRCADPAFPGVYTRMTEYLDWVLTNARMQ